MNRVEIDLLLDTYGELLTERQREVLELYIDEDLSYSEIAEILKISRAAVQDSLKKSEKLLRRYEEAIGWIERRKKIIEVLNESDDDTIKEKIMKIIY